MQNKTRAEVLIVIIALATIAISGVWIVAFLVHEKIDPTAITILVALVAPPIGSLGSMLSQTGRSQSTVDGAPEPILTEITNTAANPVPTEPQSPLQPTQPSQTAPAPVEQVSPDDALPEPPPVAPRN